MDSRQDIRTYPRAAPDIRLQVSALPDKASESLQGFVANVSLGGLFIETEQPLSPGTLLRIEFDTPGRGGKVTANAVVRWHRRVFEPRGMGVQFVEFQGVAEQHLQEWLNSILEKK